MRFSEVVDSVESLKKFVDVNKITPKEIIVVWDEDVETKKSSGDMERTNCTLGHSIKFNCPECKEQDLNRDEMAKGKKKPKKRKPKIKVSGSFKKKRR